MKYKKRIIALILMAATILMLLPLSVSAAGCNHVFGGTKWAEAYHPHPYFYYCLNGCGERSYTGDYMTKSNCADCNPSIKNCQHTNTWTNEVHPHETVCTGCCKVMGYASFSGCAQCCTNHSGTYYTSSTHTSSGHERYLQCRKCGQSIYKGTVSYLSSCDICNPPKVSSVSLHASGPSATIHSSGILEATETPASFTVYADCDNCTVTSMYYYAGGRKVSTSSSSISFTAYSQSDFQSITVYVETNTGVTDSITVNFTFARYAEAAVKWEYAGAIIRSISKNGSTIRSGLSTSIDFDWGGSGLSDSAYNTVAGLIGSYDGQTYILSGSSLIRVYVPSTGKTLGTFDTYSDFSSLCSYVSWTSQTLSAFESCRTISISYQAPKSVEGTATWQTLDGTVLHSTTASSVTGYSYIKPSQSITVAYSASSYTPKGYTYKGMRWSCGSDTGESTTKTSYSKLYNYTTSPVNVTFLYEKTPTYGSIKVSAYDGDTNQLIPSVSISCNGSSSSSNPAAFHKLKFGSYDVSASAAGYDSASGTMTISEDNANREVYLYLYRNSGDVTVYVKDSKTGKAISGAGISGAASGTTDSSGKCSFSGISFMGVQTFSASKEGYYGGSASTQLSRTKLSDTITIYLDPIPTSGDISVTVYDESTNRPISGASVSGAGKSNSTNGSGSVTFKDVLFGSYTFSASADGYYSGIGSASISLDKQSDSISIYLKPIPTSGDITVYVRDSDTGAALSGASVSGSSCYGITGSSGSITFTELDFGSYTFTASLYGYESGSGSGSISEFHTEESITIYLEKIKTDLSVDSEINGTVYQGSTIIVPATVFNDGDVNLTPSFPAKLTMTAKVNGSTVFDTQTADIIIPAFGNNLTWFTVTIPETANSVTFDFKVSVPDGVTETNLSNNTDSITAAVNVLPNRACSDASLELTPPRTFSYSNYTGNTTETRSWSVWEWNGDFVRKTYTAKLNLSAVLYPDETAGYRKQNGSTWTTRSGYGLDTEVAAAVDTNASSSATIGTLKVDAFYPEHNYSTGNNKSDRLELVNGKYVFKPLSSSVSGSRMHATPLWFPDKAYSVKYYAYDIWCPAGMLSGYTNAGVMIYGDMYDDLYTN